jgi:hypothetical protein
MVSFTLHLSDYFAFIRLLYIYQITLHLSDYFAFIRLLYIYQITLHLSDDFTIIRLLCLMRGYSVNTELRRGGQIGVMTTYE